MMLSSVANAENISIDNSPPLVRGQIVLGRISHAEWLGDTLWKQRTIGQGQRMGKPRTAD